MIATGTILSEFIERLKGADWVALDTEADSLHAYPEKLCLIQISLPGEDALIDPLAGLPLDRLWDALREHELIMHGADYDLRLLRKTHGFSPSRIFDTSIAARLIGEKRFGLNDLVQIFLGIKLEKGSQKADWARRPLTKKMEDYARNDTRCLRPLEQLLREELSHRGRLGWQTQCCDRLIEDCSRPPKINEDEIWRIKGSSRLSPPALAIVRELWRWREEEAVRSNIPPYFILSHDTAIGIAIAAVNGNDIAPSLPKNISVTRRKNLENAIARGLEIPPEMQPRPIQKIVHRSDQLGRKRFEALQRRRDREARDLQIDPTLIASKGTLSALAQDWEKNSCLLMEWQKNLLHPEVTSPAAW